MKPRNLPPRGTIAGVLGVPSRWSFGEGPCRHRSSGKYRCRTPGVGEGMSGWNVQRKLGTTGGSPRRSCTAKALRISRHAVKSRCACEWDGWGRLSDDGPGQNNPVPSEGLWGGELVAHHGGALSSPRPDTVRDYRSDHEVHEGRRQTGCRRAHAGSRLKLITRREGLV